VRAWQAADPAAAGRCAAPAAVATLFGRRGEGAAWTFEGCDGPDPGVPRCNYAYAGGHASLRLAGTEAQGWKVDQVSFGP
jgi:prepilin-type processing-associated H-X9-DG protein